MGRDLLPSSPTKWGKGTHGRLSGVERHCAPIPLAGTSTWAHTCLRLCTFSKNRLQDSGSLGRTVMPSCS